MYFEVMLERGLQEQASTQPTDIFCLFLNASQTEHEDTSNILQCLVVCCFGSLQMWFVDSLLSLCPKDKEYAR